MRKGQAQRGSAPRLAGLVHVRMCHRALCGARARVRRGACCGRGRVQVGYLRVHAGVATGPGRQEGAEARADVLGPRGSEVNKPRGGKGPREAKDVGGQNGGKRGQPVRHSCTPAAAAPPSSLPRPSDRCRTAHRGRVTPRARLAARASVAPPVAPAVEAGHGGTAPCGGAATCAVAERARGGGGTAARI